MNWPPAGPPHQIGGSCAVHLRQRSLSRDDLPRFSAGGLDVRWPGLLPWTRGTLSEAESVTFRSGRSTDLRAGFVHRFLPTGLSGSGSGPSSRLQWRYRGGLSPPSLFSLGGHLNGQWLYFEVAGSIWPPQNRCQ